MILMDSIFLLWGLSIHSLFNFPNPQSNIYYCPKTDYSVGAHIARIKLKYPHCYQWTQRYDISSLITNGSLSHLLLLWVSGACLLVEYLLIRFTRLSIFQIAITIQHLVLLFCLADRYFHEWLQLLILLSNVKCCSYSELSELITDIAYN